MFNERLLLMSHSKNGKKEISAVDFWQSLEGDYLEKIQMEQEDIEQDDCINNGEKIEICFKRINELFEEKQKAVFLIEQQTYKQFIDNLINKGSIDKFDADKLKYMFEKGRFNFENIYEKDYKQKIQYLYPMVLASQDISLIFVCLGRDRKNVLSFINNCDDLNLKIQLLKSSKPIIQFKDIVFDTDELKQLYSVVSQDLNVKNIDECLNIFPHLVENLDIDKLKSPISLMLKKMSDMPSLNYAQYIFLNSTKQQDINYLYNRCKNLLLMDMQLSEQKSFLLSQESFIKMLHSRQYHNKILMFSDDYMSFDKNEKSFFISSAVSMLIKCRDKVDDDCIKALNSIDVQDLVKIRSHFSISNKFLDTVIEKNLIENTTIVKKESKAVHKI